MLRALYSAVSIACFALAGGVAHAEKQLAWDVWLEGVRAEALEKGISQETVDIALTGIQPIERAIVKDRNQPEDIQTAETYVSKRVSASRIASGKKYFAQHREMLDRIGDRYGVQPRYIVAIWGMETNYGMYPLSHDAVTALATLAWDPRRSSYFRKELFAALRILDEGHIAHADMKGSWAGAMGQSQFMPSSFLAYAKDGDSDGRVDIWTNEADVFASIANYLAEHGWRDDHMWGRKVAVPAEFTSQLADLIPEKPKGCRAIKKHTRKLRLGEWHEYGVRRLDGGQLPARDLEASLVFPDGEAGSAYLTYGNFRAILGYNCANLYGIAVGTLAEKIQ